MLDTPHNERVDDRPSEVSFRISGTDFRMQAAHSEHADTRLDIPTE